MTAAARVRRIGVPLILGELYGFQATAFIDFLSHGFKYE